MKDKKKWYKKWWVILLLWPVFLLVWISRLIWRQKWNKNYRIAAIALLWGFVFVYGGIIDNNNKKLSASLATQPAWQCIGPDGKKIDLSQEACDEFNNKWKQGATQASTSATAQPTKASEHELDAIVKFNETAFLITNNEKDNWNDCQFEINSGGLFSNGYTYKQNELKAHDAIIIPYREFAKGDGTRFNPYTTKAQSLFISCKVNGVLSSNYFTIQ
jgi:hypothetical protein